MRELSVSHIQRSGFDIDFCPVSSVDGGLWVDSGPMVSSDHRQSDPRSHGEIEESDVSRRAEQPVTMEWKGKRQRRVVEGQATSDTPEQSQCPLISLFLPAMGMDGRLCHRCRHRPGTSCALRAAAEATAGCHSWSDAWLCSCRSSRSTPGPGSRSRCTQ